ncbi:MAG TPA: hypothetical protein VHF25_04330, partial [Nitriliruptorales bacterium]|nr:hypothetical protein [Nitriliruptorales bacterium]
MSATRRDGDGRADATLRRADLRRRQRDVVEEGRPQEGVEVFRPVERAVLVGVQLPDRSDARLNAGLDE